MKTETILGEQVVRVDGLGDTCTVANNSILVCAFYARDCRLSGSLACGFSSDIFIRPDQIVDYLATKLVS